MKYEIERECEDFKPIQIILTLETREELKQFKDAVSNYECFSWNLYEDLKKY